MKATLFLQKSKVAFAGVRDFHPAAFQICHRSRLRDPAMPVPAWSINLAGVHSFSAGIAGPIEQGLWRSSRRA